MYKVITKCFLPIALLFSHQLTGKRVKLRVDQKVLSHTAEPVNGQIWVNQSDAMRT